jgi:pimeloyl-ACP methyl ester carboxylesterase/DNA-binding SARP family transcriptional activator
VRLEVLGPVVVAGPLGPRRVTPRQARELLALLGFAAPAAVSLFSLVDTLWDDPPVTATKSVQANLSRARRLLEGGIVGGPAGYQLVDGVELDLRELDVLTRRGRRALEQRAWTGAIEALGAARRLVRGVPELPATVSGAALRARFGEEMAALGEDYVEALVRGGRATEAIVETEPSDAERAPRQHLTLLRAIAFAQAGRFVDAVRAIADLRRDTGSAGLEPTQAVQVAERNLLDGVVPAVPDRPRASTRSQATPAQPGPPADRCPVRYVEVQGRHVAYRCLPARRSAPRDLVLLRPGALPLDCVLDEPRLGAAHQRLTELARITWFDRSGIGLSERCSADVLPSIDDWLDDLRAVIRAVGIDKPVLRAAEDTVSVALHYAGRFPKDISGVVLGNACARFTRSGDYPYGVDPQLAQASVRDVTDPAPPADGYDLLAAIAASVSDDPGLRSWWDTAGRRGASPQVARALRARHQSADLRQHLAAVTAPILHLVNPRALFHDPGHDTYLNEHLADIQTIELPGDDELWWLSDAGVEAIADFLRN